MKEALVYANPRLPLFWTGVADGAATDAEDGETHAEGEAELDWRNSAVDKRVLEDEDEDDDIA